MSLTRAEWEVIWYSIKKIEELENKLYCGVVDFTFENKVILTTHIQLIKEKVQKVIGQME